MTGEHTRSFYSVNKYCSETSSSCKSNSELDIIFGNLNFFAADLRTIPGYSLEPLTF